MRTSALRVLVAVVAVFTMSLAAVDADGAAPALARGVYADGTFERIPQEAIARWGAHRVVPGDAQGRAVSGSIILIPEARRLLQFFTLHPGGGSLQYTETGVLVRDLDTRRVLHAFELPVLHRGTQSLTLSGNWMHALDGTRRLFLVTAPAGQSPPRLLELDLRTFAVKTHSFGPAIERGQRAANIGKLAGIAYDRRSDSVVALEAISNGTVAHALLFIDKVPLDGSAPQARRIRSCVGSVASVDNAGQTLQQSILFTDDHVFVPCMTPNYTILVVRMPRSSAYSEGAGEEVEIAGPTYLETSLADEAGRRIHILTLSGELWVFDADEMAFVGVIATVDSRVLNPKIGMGLDQRSGRVFFQSPTLGFGVVEGRFFPVPQAVTVPANASRASEQIASDPVTGRVYVLRGYFGEQRPAYDVYRLDPAPVPPPPPDPDRSTADMAEEAGKTESRYFASGSGYGVRVVLAKGAVPAVPMAGMGQQSTAQAFDNHLNSKCGYTDRELASGQVGKAEYDHGSARAEAAAAEVDERTKVDLQQPSRCDVYIRDGTGDRVPGVLGEVFKAYPPAAQHDKGPGWKYEPATCSTSVGDSEKANAGRRDADAPEIGTNEVNCPSPGGKLEARASSALHGGLSVGRTSTDVVIERTSQGVESRVTSIASEIALPGNVTIGEIRSTAISRANGRPQKKPMSRHTVSIKNVRIGDMWACTVECHPDEVVERLRGSGLGRVEFRVMNTPDQQLLNGTPKGAQTAVQKSPARQASDRALLGDFRAEVSAFEIVVYNDNFEYGKARQVYQFAGVSTTAGYNIVPTSGGAASDEHDDAPLRPDGLPGAPVEPSDQAALAGGASVSDSALSAPLAEAVASTPRGPRQFVQAVLDGLRLIVTSPTHALLFLTAWAVFGFPAMVSRRRRLLVQASRG